VCHPQYHLSNKYRPIPGFQYDLLVYSEFIETVA
jgi:hypothetical protein